MAAVRVCSAPAHFQRYVGRIGEVTGVTGQFVRVRFPDDPYQHLFLPGELLEEVSGAERV